MNFHRDKNTQTNGEMKNMSEIANNIKKLRQEKQISLEQLAEQLEVMPQVLECWENGDINPDIQTLTQIANIFDVSVEYIIYSRPKKQVFYGFDYSAKNLSRIFTDIGVIIAAILSYLKWGSIGWAILHGILNWFYVIYYFIKY